MADNRTLLYMFRGKVETEEVNRWNITNRAIVLINCTRATMYMVDQGGHLLEYGPHYWLNAKNPPNEIKLAALLVN